MIWIKSKDIASIPIGKEYTFKGVVTSKSKTSVFVNLIPGGRTVAFLPEEFEPEIIDAEETK